MTLIPFAKQNLRLNEALPFGLRDAGGRLLLSAGTRIAHEEALTGLLAGELFADETESSEWRRRLAGAMDAKMLQNASLQEITQARPDAEREKKAAREPSLSEQWSEAVLILDAALRDVHPATPWLQRLLAVHERALRLYERKPDASLYWLIYQAGNSTQHYSSSHALLCMLMARDTAQRLEWPEAMVRSLTLAALTMNVAIRRLMDQLAAADRHISADNRADILAHPEQSARMLASAGVADKLQIGIVRLHHDDSLKHRPLDQLDDTQRGARLLRRVDIFTAKLSRRANRTPMSPVQAAREACLGATGVPDEIGGALLKAVGLYPPGSFVELVSGECGIVIARGRQANMPVVAALIGVAGTPLGVPAMRDTADRRHAVKCAVRSTAVRVVPPHEALMGMR